MAYKTKALNAAHQRRYRANNLERERARQRRYAAAKRAHGKLTPFRADGTHQRTGIVPTRPSPRCCEICGQPPAGKKKFLCMDHCHLTERFRGWLCDRCNRALGLFGDDLRVVKAAVRYLENA